MEALLNTARGSTLRGPSKARRLASHSTYALQRAWLRRIDRPLADALAATGPYSLMSQRKRLGLYAAGREAINLRVEGAFVEIGVHRGGGMAVLAPLIRQSAHPIHLFDRWGDLPSYTHADGEVGQMIEHNYLRRMRTDRSQLAVRADVERLYFDELGIPRERVTLHEGWFEETFPSYDGPPIAFAHIDADFYESMCQALSFFDQRGADLAVVVLDDWQSWPGVRLAYEEFAQATKRRVQLRIGPDQAMVLVGAHG